MHKIEISKHIPRDRWDEFFSMFSHGNKGRVVGMEVVGQDQGDEKLVELAPLASIDYQLIPGGDSVTICTGHNGAAYCHTVEAPHEVWTGQDENGVVMAMDITDQEGNHTILRMADISPPQPETSFTSPNN